MEALVIVLFVSFLALGWRTGIVVALSVPLVLGIVFIVMNTMSLDLHRITLGALIIALGLLVDDAIIAVEMMVVKMEQGWDRMTALGDRVLELGPQPASDGRYKHFKLTRDADGVAWLLFDRADASANTLSSDVMEEFDAVLAAIETERPAGLVIRSAKSSGFIAGADVNEFRGASDAEMVETRIRAAHGGLRYLEYYEFRLVREALIEREILWGIAPHIIRPLRFVLPHHAGLRPAWLLRLGLFLYDHIGGRHLLPATRSVDLKRDEVGKPLIPNRYSRAFEYSDCFVDDARLVVLNARDAADKGAEIRTRTRATEIRQSDGIWTVSMISIMRLK